MPFSLGFGCAIDITTDVIANTLISKPVKIVGQVAGVLEDARDSMNFLEITDPERLVALGVNRMIN